MARYTEAVCRICRREGDKLFLKGDRCYTDKCAIARRSPCTCKAKHGCAISMVRRPMISARASAACCSMAVIGARWMQRRPRRPAHWRAYVSSR